jgi:hypothetical protein
MNKTLPLLSLICLATLTLGTVLFGQSPAFWLASGAANYEFIREALMVILVLQLVTEPPRNVWFRILAGSLAVFVGMWALQATYANRMLFLDTLSFLSAAIATGITALERTSERSITA